MQAGPSPLLLSPPHLQTCTHPSTTYEVIQPCFALSHHSPHSPSRSYCSTTLPHYESSLTVYASSHTFQILHACSDTLMLHSGVCALHTAFSIPHSACHSHSMIDTRLLLDVIKNARTVSPLLSSTPQCIKMITCP